jgi:predicted helicase
MDRRYLWSLYQMPKLFPSRSATNRAIMVKQRWSGLGHLALMVDALPDAQSDGGTQCFPLYLYDGDDAPDAEAAQGSLFASSKKAPAGIARRDGITDAGLLHFESAYPDETITKEDVFYYVYGILHSPDYRTRYADNLGKELPRIPRVASAEAFWAFSRAGRALGDLHVAFEKAPEHAATIEERTSAPPAERYRVTKMKFGGGGREKDKSVIVYNDFVTVRGIPLSAYDYVVNGKPAIEWVMERQSVTTDKASGIVKDANDYATETVGDPRYPLSLLLRVITVSLETNRIVTSLPALDILHPDAVAYADKPVTEDELVVEDDMLGIDAEGWDDVAPKG